MIPREINVFGVFVSPFPVYCLIALVVFIPLRLLCDRLKVDRWVWHRHLFDVSLFVIVLCVVGLML